MWLSNYQRQFSTKSLYQSHRSAFAGSNAGRSCTMPGFRQFSSSSQESREQKSRKMFIYLSALVVAMVGGSYAAVPLYRRFCQATGYGGTIQRREVWISFFSKCVLVFLLSADYLILFRLLKRKLLDMIEIIRSLQGITLTSKGGCSCSSIGWIMHLSLTLKFKQF